MACAPDVPTLERLAAAYMLLQRIPDLKIRVINIVDLMDPPVQHRTSLWPERLRMPEIRNWRWGQTAATQGKKARK